MIKVTEKNRSLIFLAATMIIGVLIIGVLMLVENNDVPPPNPPEDFAGTNFKVLENKIANIKNQNFSPDSYNTLASEIDESYRQELITAAAKNNLISNLAAVYSNLVYNQCEFYLTGNDIHTSNELLSWLSQLENITSKNSKIDFYRGQIDAYLYYSETLPSKVSDFISPGITNFDQSIYDSLKEEVKNMPKLSASYKNRAKFNAIRTDLTSELEKFNADWATAGVTSE